jgi:hypothetical protein
MKAQVLSSTCGFLNPQPVWFSEPSASTLVGAQDPRPQTMSGANQQLVRTRNADPKTRVLSLSLVFLEPYTSILVGTLEAGKPESLIPKSQPLNPEP